MAEIPEKFNIFAVGAFPPARGGGERSGWTIVKELGKLGHQITVFAQQIPGEQPPTARNVNMVLFPTKRQLDVPPQDFALANPIRGFWDRNVAKKPLTDALERQIAIQRPDVLLVNFGAPWASFVNKIAKRYGIPTIVILHGSDAHALTRPEYAHVRRATVRSYNKADARIAVADYLKEVLQGMGVSNIETIRNAIDRSRFRSLPKEHWPYMRKRLGIPKNDTVFVHVSYLGPVKDPVRIVEAAEMALKKNPHMHFLIVGDGPLRGNMEQAAHKAGVAKKFTFVGEATPAQVRHYMSLSDVHVMASLREGTPLTILEAAAAGLPTIATRVGGIPEMVLSGYNGELFDPQNSKQLAEKLLLLSHKKYREKLSRGARAFSHGSSLKKAIGRYNATIRTVIQKKKEQRPKRKLRTFFRRR